MKVKNTWVVLLLAVVLGGWVYWHEVRGAKQRSQGRAAAAKLLPVTADAVTAIRLQHSGELFQLEKRNNLWVLVRPVPAPADPVAVASFLDTLAAARVEDEVGGGDLPRYGLDAPAALLEADAGGKTYKLQFGRINPQQTLVYAMRGDDKDVLLTTSTLLTYSLNTAFGWRDKRITNLADGQLQRFTIRTPNRKEAAFALDPRFGWRTLGEVAWRVDPSRGLSVAGELAHLRAAGIAAENKADAGKFQVDNHRVGLQGWDAAGNVVVDLVVGMNDGFGAYFATVPDKPEVFKIDERFMDVAFSLVNEPRDRRALMPFDPEKNDMIRVVSIDDRFELRRRSAQDWKVVSSTRVDSTFALATGSVDALLVDLATMEVEGFPARQPLAATMADALIVLHLFSGGTEVAGLEIGTKQPDGLFVYARGPGEPAVFLLSPSNVMKVPFDLERLKSEESAAPEGGDKG